MIDLIQNIYKGAVVVAAFIGSIIQPVQAPTHIEPVEDSHFETTVAIPAEDIFGATFQTPDVRALFTTTLASKITATDVSMTLSDATDGDGNALSSSTYGFILDEGTSVEEFVLADCTATVCTNMTRGLSMLTGTTTVASNRFEHRRGASIKITTAPSVLFGINVFKGRQNIENVIRYNTHPTFNNSTDIVDRAYVDSVAFGAVPAASETAAGFGELATQIQAASSTSLGETGARLIIPGSMSTSTYNAATAPLRVVMTQNNGKIDSNFITLPSTATYATTSLTIGSFSAWNIGMQKQIITTTGTSTFVIPSGITKLWVEVIGAGGAGGTDAETTLSAGGGGGGGGYAQEIVDVSATSSIQVYVGPSGGTRTTFGTIGFHFLSATGGTAGSNQVTSGGGGGGGVGSSGDINLGGYSGGDVVSGATGRGGGTFYGIGGSGWGMGGDGCDGTDGNPCSSNGPGTQGVIIVRW